MNRTWWVRGAWCVVRRGLGVGVALLVVVTAAAAQTTQLRSRLRARGLPNDLINQVVAVAAEAAMQGLPTDPLADRAIEGYAKHVSPERIIANEREFVARMSTVRATLRAARQAPSGGLIAAAAEAMGRGMAATQIGVVVRAAPQESLAVPGLLVAATLAGQGMEPGQAAEVVASAIQSGRSVPQILNLPSTARALQARGLTPEAIGSELLRSPGRPADAGQSGPQVLTRPTQPPGVVRRP